MTVGPLGELGASIRAAIRRVIVALEQLRELGGLSRSEARLLEDFRDIMREWEEAER